MPLTFTPLWKLLIARNMTKEDLRHVTGLSTATSAKMGKDSNVITDMLARICEASDCRLKRIALALAMVSKNDGDSDERQS